MSEISKWAKADLSTVGYDDDKVCTSLKHLCRGILDGIYQLRHINVVSVVEEWSDKYVYSDSLKSAVKSECLDFSEQLAFDDYEPVSSFADLLVKGRLPVMPSTLRCNDYVNIDELKSLLRRYFNETQ